MIDHVTISVNDLAKSRAFYEKALIPFGYKVSFGKNGIFWAFDIGNGALFEIAQHKETTKVTSCHIAFRAKGEEQVRQFYTAAIAAGGKCNGAPGLRPQYTESYFASFVLDPSGHNIESVFDSNVAEV